jgi:hypothetical protein
MTSRSTMTRVGASATRFLLRHRLVTAGVFAGATVVLLLVVIIAPGKFPIGGLLGIALLCAFAASLGAAYALERPNACFRTREEVERVLGLTVLASYDASNRR